MIGLAGRHIARQWSLLVVVGQGLAVLAYLAALWLVEDEEQAKLLSNVVGPAIGGAAMVTAARTALSLTPPGQRLWLLMVWALGAFTLGDILWLYYESILEVENPVGTLADAAYLAYYPLVLAALLSCPFSPRGRLDVAKFWLDTLTVGLGAAMLVWFFALYPTFVAHRHEPFTALVVLAYPIGDVVLLFGIASVLLRRSTTTWRDPFIALAGGLGFFVVADLLYGQSTLENLYVSGEWPDVLWFAGITLMSAAAEMARRTQPADEQEKDVPSRGFSWMPYGAIGLGYGTLVLVVHDEATTRLAGLVVGSVALTIVVVARQILAVRENETLLVERAARKSDERISELIRNSSDYLTVVDAHGIIRYQSPAAERLFGHLSDAANGLPLLDLVHPDDQERAGQYIRAAISNEGITPAIEWRVRHPDGRWLDMEVIGNNPPGTQLGGVVMTARDVSDRKRLEAELAHQAFHDSLTGFANRALFRAHLEAALLRSARRELTVAVLLIDLDHFKHVNDSLGHLAGDRLLVEVARRIRRAIRVEDVAARLGGDEFAILLESAPDAEEARAIGTRVLEELAAPIRSGGRELFVTASIGVAFDDEAVTEVDDLLRNADVAMYRAKAEGRNRIAFFEPLMHAQAARRIELEAELRHSVDRQDFTVHYQPILRAADASLAGFEALVRWAHPVQGLIHPGEFIDLAEETGLIVPIGREVLRTACQTIQAWNNRLAGRPPLFLTVNLSVHQIEHPDLVEDVRRALDTSGMDPSTLVLEITESALLRDSEAVTARLHSLKMLGVRLAMDDFGTGYSSLSYLQRLPLDIVKIDKAFVDDVDATLAQGALVQAIVTLANTLRLETIAEGVERAEQVRALRQVGTTYCQGYYYARPLTAGAAAAYVESTPGLVAESRWSPAGTRELAS